MQPDAVRQMWAAGDYATFGDLFAGVGSSLVEQVGVAGLDVLDVATGTGNTALAVARERAAARALDVRWLEGDMRKLDIPDASFDRVLSTFGAMTAPEPATMA